MTSDSILLSSATYSDAAEQERGLPGWQQHYAQLGSGPYRGSIQSLSMPGVTICRERINVVVEQQTRPPEGTLLFVWSLSRQAAWRVNSTRQTTEVMTITKGGTELVAVGEENSDLLMAVVDADRIAIDTSDLPDMQIMPLCSESAAIMNWFGGLITTYVEASQPPPAELQPILPDLVTERLTGIFHLMSRQGTDQAARGASLDIFQGVQELVDSDETEPLTVAGLAQALELPQETLRQAFIDTVGVSPSIWLRQRRLDGARRDLSRAGQTGRSVSDIAMHWGFFHLGRFSAYYAELYGESPSQTLRG